MAAVYRTVVQALCLVSFLTVVITVETRRFGGDGGYVPTVSASSFGRNLSQNSTPVMETRGIDNTVSDNTEARRFLTTPSSTSLESSPASSGASHTTRQDTTTLKKKPKLNTTEAENRVHPTARHSLLLSSAPSDLRTENVLKPSEFSASSPGIMATSQSSTTVSARTQSTSPTIMITSNTTASATTPSTSPTIMTTSHTTASATTPLTSPTTITTSNTTASATTQSTSPTIMITSSPTASARTQPANPAMMTTPNSTLTASATTQSTKKHKNLMAVSDGPNTSSSVATLDTANSNTTPGLNLETSARHPGVITPKTEEHTVSMPATKPSATTVTSQASKQILTLTQHVTTTAQKPTVRSSFPTFSKLFSVPLWTTGVITSTESSLFTRRISTTGASELAATNPKSAPTARDNLTEIPSNSSKQSETTEKDSSKKATNQPKTIKTTEVATETTTTSPVTVWSTGTGSLLKTQTRKAPTTTTVATTTSKPYKVPTPLSTKVPTLLQTISPQAASVLQNSGSGGGATGQETSSNMNGGGFGPFSFMNLGVNGFSPLSQGSVLPGQSPSSVQGLNSAAFNPFLSQMGGDPKQFAHGGFMPSSFLFQGFPQEGIMPPLNMAGTPNRDPVQSQPQGKDTVSSSLPHKPAAIFQGIVPANNAAPGAGPAFSLAVPPFLSTLTGFGSMFAAGGNSQQFPSLQGFDPSNPMSMMSAGLNPARRSGGSMASSRQIAFYGRKRRRRRQTSGTSNAGTWGGVTQNTNLNNFLLMPGSNTMNQGFGGCCPVAGNQAQTGQSNTNQVANQPIANQFNPGGSGGNQGTDSTFNAYQAWIEAMGMQTGSNRFSNNNNDNNNINGGGGYDWQQQGLQQNSWYNNGQSNPEANQGHSSSNSETSNAFSWTDERGAAVKEGTSWDGSWKDTFPGVDEVTDTQPATEQRTSTTNVARPLVDADDSGSATVSICISTKLVFLSVAVVNALVAL